VHGGSDYIACEDQVEEVRMRCLREGRAQEKTPKIAGTGILRRTAAAIGGKSDVAGAY
jgi:hypothetical protein